MNIRESLKLVAGSVTVYVIMAACSAGTGSTGLSPEVHGGERPALRSVVIRG